MRFVDAGGRVSARLGVIVVAEITINPNGGRFPFFWAMHLPMTPRTPRPVADIDLAKRLISEKVREWCDAAGVGLRGNRGVHV